MTYEDKKNGKRTFRSFKKNGKERKECSVLFKRSEKNAKNRTFFLKERKRTQRSDAQPCVLCPELSVLFNPNVCTGGEGAADHVLSGLGTPFFSVLFRAVRYVLFHSKKRTLRSFPFFSRVFGDL